MNNLEACNKAKHIPCTRQLAIEATSGCTEKFLRTMPNLPPTVPNRRIDATGPTSERDGPEIAAPAARWGALEAGPIRRTHALRPPPSAPPGERAGGYPPRRSGDIVSRACPLASSWPTRAKVRTQLAVPRRRGRRRLDGGRMRRIPPSSLPSSSRRHRNRHRRPPPSPPRPTRIRRCRCFAAEPTPSPPPPLRPRTPTPRRPSPRPLPISPSPRVRLRSIA